MTTALDVMDALKMRLKDRQAKLTDNGLVYRIELDALSACVEVLAQIIDGRKDVLVPDYASDPKIRVPSTVRIGD